MKKEINKDLLWFLIINFSLFILSLIYVLLFWSNNNFLLSEGCFFQSVFKIYCPGCGGSRSLSSLFQFDLISSFILYPPILISIIVLLYYDIRYLLSFFLKLKASKYWCFLLIPISIILTFLIRNLLLLCFGIDTVGDFIK